MYVRIILIARHHQPEAPGSNQHYPTRDFHIISRLAVGATWQNLHMNRNFIGARFYRNSVVNALHCKSYPLDVVCSTHGSIQITKIIRPANASS